MKDMFCGPGKVSGLVLRIGQCCFASASIAVMVTASGFSTSTAFCFLIACMGVQLLWSFALACLDVHALKSKRDLQNHVLVSRFVVGDWVTALLSLGAACASAGVAVLFKRDTDLCVTLSYLFCSRFHLSIGLAFASWFLIAVSSHVLLWLWASV